LKQKRHIADDNLFSGLRVKLRSDLNPVYNYNNVCYTVLPLYVPIIAYVGLFGQRPELRFKLLLCKVCVFDVNFVFNVDFDGGEVDYYIVLEIVKIQNNYRMVS